MYSVKIYGKLTGEIVEEFDTINGDENYGLINVLQLLLKRKYFSPHFFYHVTYLHETWVFTSETLLGRVCDTYNDIAEIIGVCKNYVKD